MDMKAMFLKYGVTVGIAFGAIWASNNVAAVQKIVGKASGK